MPERRDLLRELFFLLTDKQEPARFGAGLDPTGFALDPSHQATLEEKIAAFTERWIREPRYVTVAHSRPPTNLLQRKILTRCHSEFKLLTLTIMTTFLDAALDNSVAGQIPLELPPLKPTPPPSPTRRDSAMLDMSEEVAAVERELIKPEYRKTGSGSVGGEGSNSRDRHRTPNGHIGDGMAVDGHQGSASPTRDRTSSATSHRRQHSLISPFPVTFHSPSFSASTPPLKQNETPFPLTLHSVASQEPSTSSPAQNGAQASTQAESSQAGPSNPSPKKASKPTPNSVHFNLEESDALPLKSFPVPYPPELPPLPEYLLKNRMNVGGLAMKKARDRVALQQNPQLAATLPTSADLYKLGVSRAVHSSIRSLVGAGAPPPEKARTGGKILSTADWQVVIGEMQSQRAMERIEQLKAEKTWSLRQFKKHKPPATYKAHWDYLLEEMTWMATDFKQETRWKVASAYELAKAVKTYHKAKTDEERMALQIKVRPPTFLSDRPNGADGLLEEEDTDMAETIIPNSQEAAADTSLSVHANGEAEQPPSVTATATSNAAATSSAEDKKEGEATLKTPATTDIALPTPTPAPEPRYKKYQHQLLKARAPLFDMTVDTTVFDLAKAGLPDAYTDVTTYDLTNELFQELMTYGPPAGPSNDTRINRRIDESNTAYTRITNASHLLQRKPILVSTLQPARKRKASGAWDDMTDIAGEEGKDLLNEMFGSASGKPIHIPIRRMLPC